jgi:hypothetical protein
MTLRETSGAVGKLPAADFGAAAQTSKTELTPAMFREAW